MELKNWYLRQYGEVVVGVGDVYNNKKFPDGMNITTSRIESLNVNMQDKCLEIVTHSGSHYKAAFAEISCDPEDLKITRASLWSLKTSSDFVNEAVVLAKKTWKDFAKALDKELLNGDFYMELSSVSISNTYFKYKDKVLKVRGYCHVGMFVDSFLYRIPGVVDFRHYEFDFNGTTTYHISDTIKRLVVKNIHTQPVQIDNVVYPAGQTTITCITEENHQEGLISPDCVNGKSVFSKGE